MLDEHAFMCRIVCGGAGYPSGGRNGTRNDAIDLVRAAERRLGLIPCERGGSGCSMSTHFKCRNRPRGVSNPSSAVTVLAGIRNRGYSVKFTGEKRGGCTRQWPSRASADALVVNERL